MKAKEYIPVIFDKPRVIEVVSAWFLLPVIIKDIITRFKLKTDLALEFGVERGYSTTALSNYFGVVYGVDPFNDSIEQYQAIKKSLTPWPNIVLGHEPFQTYIKRPTGRFDLIHIDIIHTYEDTFACGDWALQHSDCVIFHDTTSFKEVMKACEDLSDKHGFDFYNYPYDNGLGILVKRK